MIRAVAVYLAYRHVGLNDDPLRSDDLHIWDDLLANREQREWTFWDVVDLQCHKQSD